jgi:integrase
MEILDKIKVLVISNGYIQLRVSSFVDGKQKQVTKGVGIRLEDIEDFDKKREKIRSTNKNSKLLNKQIEEAKEAFAKELSKDKNFDINQEIQTYLKRFTNYNSRTTIEASLKKFEQWLTKENKDLQEFNKEDLQAYYAYLLSDVKQSANAYINNLKSFLVSLEKFSFGRYFDNFRKKTTKPKIKNRLDKSQLTNLINTTTTYKENDGVYVMSAKEARAKGKLRKNTLRTRKMLTLQILFNSPRIGDMLCLQWSNFQVINDEIFLKYVMSKTKKEMLVKVTDIALETLEHFIIETLNANNLPYLYKENFSSIEKQQNIKSTLTAITSSDLSNQLVFFRKEIDQNILTKDTEARRKRLRSKIYGYNLSVANVCTLEGLPKITSHSTRNTIAQILIQERTYGIAHIKETLGHSSIAITSQYIASLNNIETSDLNAQLFSSLKKE